jgi:hypothetical protein
MKDVKGTKKGLADDLEGRKTNSLFFRPLRALQSILVGRS